MTFTLIKKDECINVYRDGPQQIWNDVFNGSETHWVVDDVIIPRGSDYVFRVAAENAHGLGPFSFNSTAFTFVSK